MEPLLCDFCLFELGTTSLKFYYRVFGQARIQKIKFPWSVGHEVFQTGVISPASADAAVAGVREVFRLFNPLRPVESIVAFATGAFRDARNVDDFRRSVRDETGLRLYVISGDQEAALLKSVYLSERLPRPGFVFDLGGGSLQWVWLGAEYFSERGSIPLGAIRLKNLLNGNRNPRSETGRALVEGSLSGLPKLGPERVYATGGTVKSIARSLATPVFSADELDDLQERVIRDGPPEFLKPHRRPIFLPGILIVRSLMRAVGVTEMRYRDLSVGRAMLQKVRACTDDARSASASQILSRLHYSTVLPVA